MNKSQKQAILLDTLSRMLILPVMLTTSVAIAMPQQQTLVQISPDGNNQAPANSSGTSTSPLNPRPSIFNEPPYNRARNTSPTDSNAPTTQPPDTEVTPLPTDTQQPNTPTTTEPGSTIQPPLPESQQAPSAVVTPVDGKVNIKLINATKAAINYQVVEDTNQRTLTGDADVTLQNITAPTTVTFERQDRGLLKVTTQATSAGLLEVTFDETTSLDESRTTMRVQADGIVLLN